MNKEEWLEDVVKKYGQVVADKCAEIITGAEVSRRSKACDEMFGVILDMPEDKRHNRSDICEALYDAGYRKFEIVEEDV